MGYYMLLLKCEGYLRWRATKIWCARMVAYVKISPCKWGQYAICEELFELIEEYVTSYRREVGLQTWYIVPKRERKGDAFILEFRSRALSEKIAELLVSIRVDVLEGWLVVVSYKKTDRRTFVLDKKGAYEAIVFAFECLELTPSTYGRLKEEKVH